MYQLNFLKLLDLVFSRKGEDGQRGYAMVLGKEQMRLKDSVIQERKLSKKEVDGYNRDLECVLVEGLMQQRSQLKGSQDTQELSIQTPLWLAKFSAVSSVG